MNLVAVANLFTVFLKQVIVKEPEAGSNPASHQELKGE